MKKTGIWLLVVTVLLCGCNNTPATSSTENSSSAAVSEESAKEDSSKKENPSGNVSSQMEVSTVLLREIDGEKYFDVSAAMALSTSTDDVSVFFPEPDGFVGYYIEGGDVCSVDADTMRRVLKYPFKGDGAIKWTGFVPENYTKNPDQYDGVLPISKMNDPLYVNMCIPNEQHSYMDTVRGRMNASNLYEITEPYRKALPIGAIYQNPDKELPADAEITLCFNSMRLAVRIKDADGWTLPINLKAPVDLCNLYPLPWQLEGANPPVKSIRKPNSDVTWVDDHYEVKMKGSDFQGYGSEDERVEGSVLHFWGENFYFKNGTDVLGLAAAYTVWVKEPEWAYYLTADIGTDVREDNGHCEQAFTGINFAITDKPRTVYGHNVGPKRYDEIMDSEKVCELLGIDRK